MTKKSIFGLEKVPDDRSVIVVSDLHLGGKEDTGTAGRFNRFLDYLSTDFISAPKPCHNKADTGSTDRDSRLFPPEKIILLGDILELWDSRKRDRNRAMLDSLFPFLKMRNMDCDTIYVTGNHDEDVTELIDSHFYDREELKESAGTREKVPRSDIKLLKTKDKKGMEFVESLKVRWNGLRSFEICKRHFPTAHAEGGELGLNSGGTSYAFIHGQQFDRHQITYSISQALGRRFDPVDFIQDMASISVAKHVNWICLIVSFILLLCFISVFLIQSLNSWFVSLGIITGLFLAIISLYGVYLFGYAKRESPSSLLLASISIAAFVIFAALLIAGWYTQSIYWGLYVFGFLASAYVLVVISIPYLIAVIKRPVYNLISSVKSKSLALIVGEKKFDASKYKYESNVLIFGHTHEPDFEANTGTDKVRLLVNTGSWVNEDKESETEKNYDTFVYIDKNGPCVFRWIDEEGKIECFCKEKKNLQGKVPLCEYIEKKNLQLGN